MENKYENKLNRAIYFFLVLQIGNILALIYEFYYLNLEINQVIIIRLMGVITDILEAYLFIYIGLNINEIIGDKLKYLNINKKELIYGIKLAIIAPNIYIIKFLLANYIIIPIVNNLKVVNVSSIDNSTVLQAYITTTILAFIFGTLYYHLENKIFYIKSKITKKPLN